MVETFFFYLSKNSTCLLWFTTGYIQNQRPTSCLCVWCLRDKHLALKFLRIPNLWVEINGSELWECTFWFCFIDVGWALSRVAGFRGKIPINFLFWILQGANAEKLRQERSDFFFLFLSILVLQHSGSAGEYLNFYWDRLIIGSCNNWAQK